MRKPIVFYLIMFFMFAGWGGLNEASATETATVKMVLKNTQVNAVKDADGQPVTLKLTNAQKALIKLKAPKYKGSIIRVSSTQLRPGNRIVLIILKPNSGTPILRVSNP